MNNINKSRIYSFLIDSFLSNLIGSFFLSLLYREKDINVSSFLLFDHKFNYGFSFLLVFFMIYFILFDLFNYGQTIGKLIFSIYVVEVVNFKRLPKSKLLERTIYKTIAILILPISILLFLLKDGFTIQDKFSKTITIIK